LEGTISASGLRVDRGLDPGSRDIDRCQRAVPRIRAQDRSGGATDGIAIGIQNRPAWVDQSIGREVSAVLAGASPSLTAGRRRRRGRHWRLRVRVPALTRLANQYEKAQPTGAPMQLGEALRHIQQFKPNTLGQVCKADGRAGTRAEEVDVVEVVQLEPVAFLSPLGFAANAQALRAARDPLAAVAGAVSVALERDDVVALDQLVGGHLVVDPLLVVGLAQPLRLNGPKVVRRHAAHPAQGYGLVRLAPALVRSGNGLERVQRDSVIARLALRPAPVAHAAQSVLVRPPTLASDNFTDAIAEAEVLRGRAQGKPLWVPFEPLEHQGVKRRAEQLEFIRLPNYSPSPERDDRAHELVLRLRAPSKRRDISRTARRWRSSEGWM
jgi:hypothetical protein